MSNRELAVIYSKYLGAKFKMKLPKETEWTFGELNVRALHTLWTSNDWEFLLLLQPREDISNNADLCVFIVETLGIREMFYTFMSDRIRYGYNALTTKDWMFYEFPFPIVDQCRHLGYDFGYLNIPSLLDAMLADRLPPVFGKAAIALPEVGLTGAPSPIEYWEKKKTPEECIWEAVQNFKSDCIVFLSDEATPDGIYTTALNACKSMGLPLELAEQYKPPDKA